MSKKYRKQKEPPFWLVITIVLFLLAGILTSVIGIKKIENYDHPYLFGFIFGGIGAILGIITALKLKPFIAVNRRLKNQYLPTIMFIAVGYFGIVLLMGSLLNQHLSVVEHRGRYQVVNKIRREAHFRSPEVNSLYVNINGTTRRLQCKHEYFNQIHIGQKIDLWMYKSKLGFDYIKLPFDH
ncbi:hypothetical protein PbJCM13498_38930 [Prolixibacter bellariivorans]|uniref:Uncharacterized protein n=1 Tax=Prolixibacter bellariivorans TaxID=314319 RepID=A0A5M4B4N0_9BACT|nr:hypothetical protein [Prolixibacter bellariivorans]GET35030.1 hypothetical protein PbJCM13498_38930 [Prolixibacter bellariivorans]